RSWTEVFATRTSAAAGAPNGARRPWATSLVVDESPGIYLDQQLGARKAVDDDSGAARAQLEEARDHRIDLVPVCAVGDVRDDLDDVVNRSAGHRHQVADVLAGLARLTARVADADELALERERRLTGHEDEVAEPVALGCRSAGAGHAHHAGVGDLVDELLLHNTPSKLGATRP